MQNTAAATRKANRHLGTLAGLVVMATTLALLAALMAMGVSAEKAEAATAVTKTFSNIAEIRVPSGAVLGDCSAGPTQGIASPYPSPVKLALGNGFRQGSRVRDVNLTLKGYTHTFPDDVDVLLVHGTKSRTVMSDVGGGVPVNGINLTLDDEAANLLPEDGPLVGGTFRPLNFNGSDDDAFPAPAPDPHDGTQSLSGFDGMKANGGWFLYVRDDAGGDCGTFAGGYSLTIKAR